MNPAASLDISKDFMNCLMSTSFKLTAIPQNRKSAVTRMKGNKFSFGISLVSSRLVFREIISFVLKGLEDPS